MNGIRSIFRRKGYLLTALAAAVLLAASSGTAWAQSVTIGFVNTSGEISEKAFLSANSLTEPQRLTVRVNGLASGTRRAGDITARLLDVTITPSMPVYIGRVTPAGFVPAVPVQVGIDGTLTYALYTDAANDYFDHSDEVELVVAQSLDGTPDGNWLGESIELKLEVTGSASVSPDVYTLSVMESHVAPVAKFGQRDFTLSEQSTRVVSADIKSGITGVPLPSSDDPSVFAGEATSFSGKLSVRVSNHGLVTFDDACPERKDPQYNRKLFRIDLDGSSTADGDDWTDTNFTNTGVLTTVATIYELAATAATTDTATADLLIEGCGDGAGIRDPYITLTVMSTGLSGRTASGPTYGAIEVGSPLMVSIDSDEAVPTLSFSPTDVEIDEGGSTDTVLLAEGPNADDVGMVKLSVEGDAMVSLMQDGEMLEEMGGYVYVDLDGNSSARLMAMSHSDPDLMDGDMADKVWKLMEGGTDGAMIGEGSWFKVVVRGSTAVPALPLVGQLLLALFLMAGGARLYRRRQG